MRLIDQLLRRRVRRCGVRHFEYRHRIFGRFDNALGLATQASAAARYRGQFSRICRIPAETLCSFAPFHLYERG
jgi:hypothetical protein